MKKYNRTLLVALLIAAVFATAIGGTFAWFTDSVESSSNIIQSGTLKAGLGYAIEYDGESTVWSDASQGEIFNSKHWEPGYTEIRYLNVSNIGNLAFEYCLNVKPSAVLGELTGSNADDFVFTPYEEQHFFLEDVIEVYVVPVAEYSNIAEVRAAAGNKVKTIGEMVRNNEHAFEGGILIPAEGERAANFVLPAEGTYDVENAQYCIVLHMQESAGNEYQNLSVSNGFAIQLEAKQYTAEVDGFGTEDYDANADYAYLPSAVVIKSDLEEIKANGAPTELETAYTFYTTETPDPSYNLDVLEDPYLMWHADFVVTFDKDIDAGDVTLAGQYDFWSESWLAFSNPNAVKAGEEIRLLGGVAADIVNKEIFLFYYQLVTPIQKFQCGAYANNPALSGTTMTVELRIYETVPKAESQNNSENEETGHYETIGTFSYTFE